VVSGIADEDGQAAADKTADQGISVDVGADGAVNANAIGEVVGAGWRWVSLETDVAGCKILAREAYGAQCCCSQPYRCGHGMVGCVKEMSEESGRSKVKLVYA
jgi:hypothetical protein